MQRDVGTQPHLLLMPSFYGLVSWAIWLMLYAVRLLPWEAARASSYAIFLLVIASFMTSVTYFSPLYRRVFESCRDDEGVPGPAPRFHSARLLVTLHAIGFLGIARFIVDMAPVFGSPLAVLLVLGSEPYRLRWAGEGLNSPGVQLSYLGWIAIALTLRAVRQRALRRRWLLLAALQLLFNLIFIDRTRPIWILFTSVLSVLPYSRMTARSVIRLSVGAVIAVTILFVSIGTWVGKISEDVAERHSALPVGLQSLYQYGTCGFAYFDHLLKVEPEPAFSPQRIAYPALKALSGLGLVRHEPPSQILEPYGLPYETNVGTFLEPFYRDGGLAFTVLGILICSVGFDALAFILWRHGGALSAFAAANLCFASAISFFTPKVASFPLWLFCALGIAASLTASKVRGRPHISPEVS